MHTTPDITGRRTAATWVAATGAFLLVAAAGVFVSVRWDQIPEAAKLGLVLAITASALAGGRALKTALPATGDVLFHLGAFLLPIDLAAISIRLDMTWGELLLAQGWLVGVGIGGLALWGRSVVLRWASVGGFVVLAAGVGAVTVIPAPVALAAIALIAALLNERASMWWAAIAGLAPAVAGLAQWLIDQSGRTIGGGTLDDLGFDAAAQGATAWAVGAVSCAVLARAAHHRQDVALAFLSISTLFLGVTTSLASGDVGPGAIEITMAGGFLAFELVALVLRRDPFWRRPVAVVATITEWASVPVIAVMTLQGLLYDVWGSNDPKYVVGGVGIGIGAAAAFAGDLRRHAAGAISLPFGLLRGGGSRGANLLFAHAAVCAVTTITVDARAITLAAASVAALFVLGGRPLGHLLAAASVGLGLALAVEPLFLLAAVAVCAWAASLRARSAASTDVAFASALAAVATAGGVLVGLEWDPLAVVPICWAIALVLDREHGGLGDIARMGYLALIAGPIDSIAYGDAALQVGAVVAALAVDAALFRRTSLGIAAAVAAQPFVALLLYASDVAPAQTGLALCISAIAWSGFAAVVDGEWRTPFIVGAAAALCLGLALAADDPVALADSVIVTGGLVVALGIVRREDAVGHAGGVLIALGAAAHLAASDVQALEPYVAPVAAHMAVAGWLRRREVLTSSWVSYVPSIALLGGAALVERMSGGPEWHALVAAAVGTAAVALGGWRRLAGPLLAGTALLVGVTAHESLGALAGVPTWTWLAVAGTTLLGTGVALERTDTSPVDASRRLVDVIGERFE